MRSYLADINFWVALVLDSHAGHGKAEAFFDTLSRDQLWFCRFTQIGFLRMLTNRSVMGPQTLTQQKAWQLYDRLCGDERIQYLAEPLALDSRFRRMTQGRLLHTRHGPTPISPQSPTRQAWRSPPSIAISAA